MEVWGGGGERTVPAFVWFWPLRSNAPLFSRRVRGSRASRPRLLISASTGETVAARSGPALSRTKSTASSVGGRSPTCGSPSPTAAATSHTTKPLRQRAQQSSGGSSPRLGRVCVEPLAVVFSWNVPSVARISSGVLPSRAHSRMNAFISTVPASASGRGVQATLNPLIGPGPRVTGMHCHAFPTPGVS
eukprot:COSAG04_NODE_16_length_40397_cov_59.653677_20_plen_189_part_00